MTGICRGAAHWSSNINLQLTKKAPVIFHNLIFYNSHLIFRELNKFDVKTDVIPNGLEKYMIFFINKNLVFIDNMQFMNSSFDELIKKISDNDFKYLTEEFGSKNLELLKQRGAYPYEHMGNFKKFNDFFFFLYRYLKNGKAGDSGENLDGHITPEEYLTCQKIWDVSGMKNMGDVQNHYLKKDVLLLADVFEKFIDTCLKFDGLDLRNYFSSPGLSWDAMLKMTGAKLEKISDIDMKNG